MPDVKGRLNLQERTFAKRFGETGDAVYAAEKAGYAHPAQRASANLQKPAVMAEARKHARQLLMVDGAQIGVKVLIELALDTKQPGGVRRTAASDLVKYSGIGADEAGNAKEPHEMTAEELAQALNTLEAVAASRAKQVESAPEPSILD